MTLSCSIERSPFASRSVAEHVARGVGAAALIVLAIRLADSGGWLAAGGAPASLIGALVLMRGCPTCWIVGMIGTIIDRSRTKLDRLEPTQPVESDRPVYKIVDVAQPRYETNSQH